MKITDLTIGDNIDFHCMQIKESNNSTGIVMIYSKGEAIVRSIVPNDGIEIQLTEVTHHDGSAVIVKANTLEPMLTEDGLGGALIRMISKKDHHTKEEAQNILKEYFMTMGEIISEE